MDKQKLLQEITDLTRQEIATFDQVEQRKWGADATMIELSKQLGDLANISWCKKNIT